MSNDTDDLPPDDTIEVLDVSELVEAANEFNEDSPTVVETRNVCPGCAGDQFRLEETDQPPSSHAQAWRPGPLINGKPLWREGGCRGNSTFYWCESSVEHGHKGTLVIINKPDEGGMIVLFFPDRRIESRAVETERRRWFKPKDGAS